FDLLRRQQGLNGTPFEFPHDTATVAALEPVSDVVAADDTESMLAPKDTRQRRDFFAGGAHVTRSCTRSDAAAWTSSSFCGAAPHRAQVPSDWVRGRGDRHPASLFPNIGRNFPG